MEELPLTQSLGDQWYFQLVPDTEWPLLQRLEYAWSHGVITGRFFGTGMLYRLLPAVLPPLSVVLGSGGGFVPGMLANASARVLVVDVNMQEDTVGSITSRHNIGRMASRWFEQPWAQMLQIEAWENTTRFAALRARSELGYGSIGLLHVDTCWTVDALLETLADWLPLLHENGIVTVHDTTPGTATGHALSLLRMLGFRLLTLTHPGPVGLTLLQRVRRVGAIEGNLPQLGTLRALVNNLVVEGHPIQANAYARASLPWDYLRSMANVPEVGALVYAFTYVLRPHVVVCLGRRLLSLMLDVQRATVDSRVIVVVEDEPSLAPIAEGVFTWSKERFLSSQLVPEVLVVEEAVDWEILVACQGALVIGVFGKSAPAYDLEARHRDALHFRCKHERVVVASGSRPGHDDIPFV